MPNIIYIHVAILERYKERLKMYLNLIKESNLYKNVDKIYICYVGNENFTLDYNNKVDSENKIIITKVSSNLEDYELPTQANLYNFCKEHPDYKVLYLHTKGIHGEINQSIEDWVTYMTHFCINKWKDCINNLDSYSTVGVDLREYPTLHYSGNFWWATSNHIVSLPEPYDFSNIQKYPNPLNSPRHNQEFWICYDKESGKHTCLWESNINCYERHLHLYPKSNYSN